MSDSNMNAVSQQGGGDVDPEDREKYFEAGRVLKQKPRSSYWPFFKFLGSQLKGTDGKTLHCMLCLESEDERMKRKNIYYAGGTAGIKYHMEKFHKEKLEEAKEEDESKNKGQTSIKSFATQGSSRTNSFKKWSKSSKRWIETTESLASWVTGSSRPLSVVEDPGFVQYSQLLNPEYEVPCTKTVSNYIEKQYKIEKENLIKELEEIECVAVTTDGGSSSNAVSFQDINVHWIDQQWEMRSATLAVRQNKGSHDAPAYRQITDEVLEEFGVHGKVVLVVTDNEPKMRKAFPDDERSGCCAHIIHSSTSLGLSSSETITNVQEKTRKVATKHNKSCIFRCAVENEQAKADLKQRPIIQDVENRWGSTKVSTGSLLNHKDDADKDKYENFHAVNSALRSLKPTNLGGNFYATSSVVMPTLKSIENLLRNNLNDPYYIRDVKRIMLADLKERVRDNINIPFMIKASALDPRFKKLKFISSNERDGIFNSLKTEFDHVFFGKDLSGGRKEASENDDASKPQKRRRVEVNYDVSDEEEEAGDDTVSDISKELESYKKEDEDPDTEPMAWWRAKESKYPLLSRLARRFLCVPATSVEAERRFSDLGLLLTKRRLCLTGEHVDMILFLKDKQRQFKGKK